METSLRYTDDKARFGMAFFWQKLSWYFFLVRLIEKFYSLILKILQSR